MGAAGPNAIAARTTEAFLLYIQFRTAAIVRPICLLAASQSRGFPKMEGANLGPELRPGKICEHSGVYQVSHQAHRAPHTVMVKKGESFPSCHGCGDAVRFRLIKATTTEVTPRSKRARKKSAGRS